MPVTRKQFACGHTGKGRWCHRCADRERKRESLVAAKQAWQAKLTAAPVPLDHCPQAIAEKALEIMAALEGGESYMAFKGKRLKAMGRRDLVSIPLGWSYRLIMRCRFPRPEFLEVLSHETYNTRLASGGWPP